ncbi:MAG: XRE family transcriptional regulator, partial [Alteraurantiacibacter sp.]
ALGAPRDAILPTELVEGGALLCLEIEAGQGEYRAGDQLWMRRADPVDAGNFVNRDVLAPRSGGRFAFGRLIDRQGSLIGLLPPGLGQRQIVIDSPPWIAVGEMLVRRL